MIDKAFSFCSFDADFLAGCANRETSQVASRVLTDLGYTNVYEFDGINNWPYEIEEQI